MSKLSDFKVLSFDVYGTLIDWETGILEALEPLFKSSSSSSSILSAAETQKPTKEDILNVYHELEAAQQRETPEMAYSKLLATIHGPLAARFGLPAPSTDESTRFGQSIGSWPAFPDTREALLRLQRHYKLVVLSNVDRESFSATNAGPLKGVTFDAILTAEDIGSYKPNPRNFEYMLDHVRNNFGSKPVSVSESFDCESKTESHSNSNSNSKNASHYGKEVVLTTAQSQFHDHHPSQKLGITSVWIVRPGGIMGNRAEEIYNWKFDTLAEMADAVDREVHS